MDVIRLSNPAPALRDCVRFYAHREVRPGPTPVTHPVPARAFPILEFILGDRIQVLYRDCSRVETSPRTVLIGPQTHCHSKLRFQGTVECFVVMFQPAGLHRLFNVPMRDLTDRAYDAHSVLGAFISRFEQVIGDCGSFPERVRVANDYLLRRAEAWRCPSPISAAAAELLSVSGNARVAGIAAASGLSVRQFERGFLEQLGLTPKLFARIVRFEAALDRKARCSSKSWTEIANELGYFDQMHMIHDFSVFTGGTPTRMLAEIEVLFRERIQAIHARRQPTVADTDLDLIL
jgi:AraC-like DNA-binding protein